MKYRNMDIFSTIYIIYIHLDIFSTALGHQGTLWGTEYKTWEHKVSLAHNVSFWAQKLIHFISFWSQLFYKILAQKLTLWVSFLAQKLTECVSFWAQKLKV